MDAQAIADELNQRGMTTAALFALEVGQPFALLGGQLLWVAQPALGLFGAADWANRWAQFLENPSAVAQLRQTLQEQGPAKLRE